MRPIGCPEMSVRNYHHTLRNIPEERGSSYVVICVQSDALQNVLPCFFLCFFSSYCTVYAAGRKIGSTVLWIVTSRTKNRLFVVNTSSIKDYQICVKDCNIQDSKEKRTLLCSKVVHPTKPPLHSEQRSTLTLH